MRKWIKRMVIVFVSCVCILGMASCEDKARLMLSPVVQEMLEREGVEKSYVNSIGDYKDVRRELSIPQVTEKEFEAYFEEEFSKYGPLSDGVVQEAFGYASVQELKENERVSYVEHLKFMELMEARNDVMQQLISASSFQLDEADIANYSKRIVYREQNYASLFGYDDFEDYLMNELECTEEEFLQKCIEEGENELKQYLVIGAIAYAEGLEVESKERMDETFQELEGDFYNLFVPITEEFVMQR